MEIDKKDQAVFGILQENSKLTTSQISKRLRIPITTVHNRIKKLEKLGIIKGYGVRLDYARLERGLHAFILVTVIYRLPDGTRLTALTRRRQ